MAYDWKTIDKPRFSAGTLIPRAEEYACTPAMRISPDAGCSSPATARKVVVLPQPDGPSSVSCSPGKTLKLTPRTAGTCPKFTTR
jgi:hypothetical protein